MSEFQENPTEGQFGMAAETVRYKARMPAPGPVAPQPPKDAEEKDDGGRQ